MAGWAMVVAAAVGLAGCGVTAETSIPSATNSTAPTHQNSACRLGASADVVRSDARLAGDSALPEPASGYRLGLQPVTARSFMVVSAHPLATQAGCEVLAAGGSAADAAVAVQAMLGLVEPQSSGLGGGAFVLHYDAATRAVQTYDGRETAPAAATPNDLRWVSDTDRTPPQPNPRASGRSIGTVKSDVSRLRRRLREIIRREVALTVSAPHGPKKTRSSSSKSPATWCRMKR